MSDSWDYVQQYAVLAGYRLLVLASRLGCEDEFSRTLHDRLLAGLDGAIQTTCRITELQHAHAIQAYAFEAWDWDWAIPGQLDGEIERITHYRIVLLNELEIDFDTYEYRVDGGEWHNALSADCDGVEISYPTTVQLSDAEIGPLASIIHDISGETGITINVARVVYD